MMANGTFTALNRVSFNDWSYSNVIFNFILKLDRHDVHSSRQSVFRLIGAVLRQLTGSVSCTKHIFCEQFCLDGLASPGRPLYHYIESMPKDSALELSYVDAFAKGEALSCFSQPKTSFYKAENCTTDCLALYPKCKKQFDNSLKALFFYNFSRTGHLIGMATFSFIWTVIDFVNVIFIFNLSTFVLVVLLASCAVQNKVLTKQHK